MPLIYCDHNFIATALQDKEEYKNHLRELGRHSTVTFVLSPMHWVDAAQDANQGRSDGKSDFMDSLYPRWLFYRRSLQRKEVASLFFQFIGIPQNAPRTMGDIADVIFDLTGQRGNRDSRAFVNHLRGIGGNHPLERALRQAFETSNKNIRLYRARKFTAAVAQKVERLYIRQLIPDRTPSGVVIDEATKDDFAQQCRFDDLPSVALENAATRDNWKHKRPLSRNNFLDQQHLIALAYVDFFVTDDKKLRSLIGRITAGAPFPVAKLLTKAEFDNLYP